MEIAIQVRHFGLHLRPNEVAHTLARSKLRSVHCIGQATSICNVAGDRYRPPFGAFMEVASSDIEAIAWKKNLLWILIKDSLKINTIVIVFMSIKHLTPRLWESNGEARRALWGYHSQNGSLSYYLHVAENYRKFTRLHEFTCFVYISNPGTIDVNDLRYRLFCARKGDIDSNQLSP